MKALRTDALAGGQTYGVLMPESENPKNRLASWNSWLAQCGRFIEWRDKGPEADDRFLDGMEQLKDTLERRMPDFKRFPDEEGEFWEGEQRYKQEALGAACVAALNPDVSEEERGRAVYKRLSQSTAQALCHAW